MRYVLIHPWLRASGGGRTLICAATFDTKIELRRFVEEHKLDRYQVGEVRIIPHVYRAKRK